jgi:hypothetical protein
LLQTSKRSASRTYRFDPSESALDARRILSGPQTGLDETAKSQICRPSGKTNSNPLVFPPNCRRVQISVISQQYRNMSVKTGQVEAELAFVRTAVGMLIRF